MVEIELLRAMEEKMLKIKHNLDIVQDRQKIYVDKGRNGREFKVGDHVFLKENANKCSLTLGNCSKLVARYCEPFEILERIGLVAYTIALPASMSIHNVFHVSLLKKYIHDASHVIDWNVIRWIKKAPSKCIWYAFWTGKSNTSRIEP